MAPSFEAIENAVPLTTKLPADERVTLPTLQASKLSVSLTQSPLPIPPPAEVTTKSHTDHILTANWTSANGWSAPRIAPYSNISLPPTANVLHYATACFEGMKLYRGYDGKLRLFRPLDNCRRLLHSATRLCMPEFEPEELLELMKELCRIEGPRWLPEKTGKGNCLYIRPTMIGIDADLGFHIADEVLLFVVMTHWPKAIPDTPTEPTASPRGLKLWASAKNQVRAWPGGSGNAKLSANYGPALKTHAEGKKRGYDQVLWLFGEEGKVTEAGGANFFVIWKNGEGRSELVTAPLESGLILPGITRRSVLELARTRLNKSSEWKVDGRTVLAEQVDVLEKDFTIHEINEADRDGRLLAAFAVGTAYFVSPVTEISIGDEIISLHADRLPHAALIRTWLSDIMYGAEDSKWTEVVGS